MVDKANTESDVILKDDDDDNDEGWFVQEKFEVINVTQYLKCWVFLSLG